MAHAGLLALLALTAMPTTTSQSESAYRLGKAAPNDREARREYQRGIDSARSVLAANPD